MTSYRYVTVVRDRINHSALDEDEKWTVRVLLGKKKAGTQQVVANPVEYEKEFCHLEREVLDRYRHPERTSADELTEVAKELFDPSDYERVPSEGGDAE